MKIKVWHIPQVPMQAFERIVDNFVEAKIVLDALAFYDIFQFENNIKPDYSNAGGISVPDPEDPNEWVDWHPEGEELEILERLFPDQLIDGIDNMELDQVRQFQAELDKAKHGATAN